MLGKAVLFATMCALSFAVLGEASRVENAAGPKGIAEVHGEGIKYHIPTFSETPAADPDEASRVEDVPDPKGATEVHGRGSKYHIPSLSERLAADPGEASRVEDAPDSKGAAKDLDEALGVQDALVSRGAADLGGASGVGGAPGSEGTAEDPDEASRVDHAPGSQGTADQGEASGVQDAPDSEGTAEDSDEASRVDFVAKPAMSATEKRHMCDMAMQEFLGRLCPGESLGPLRSLLEGIGDKVVLSDEIGQPIAKATAGRLLEMGSGWAQAPVKDSFLHRSLKEFCDKQAKDPGLRTHVVDLKEKAGLGSLSDDCCLTTLFLALPKWQNQLGIRGICYGFEAHFRAYVAFEKAYCTEDDKAAWDSHGKDGGFTDTMSTRHKASGIASVWSDDMRVVADLADSIADARKDCIVLRVLRAVGGNRKEIVRKLASKPTPKNVFTLWIREDVVLCGKFNAPKPGLSLVDQLCDCQKFNIMEVRNDRRRSAGSSDHRAMPATSGSKGSKGGSKGGGVSKSAGHVGNVQQFMCASCATSRPRDAFSRNQLSKKEGRRCITCVKE